MIDTAKTRRAMEIAYAAHRGQVDKAGVPYIYHPIHLAKQMETEEECIVALLHDVVEDTAVTIEQLEKEFSETVIQALILLAHDDSVEYMEYIKRIKPNPLAKKVKKADLKHNSDLERLPKITEKDKKRQVKYQKALQILDEEV